MVKNCLFEWRTKLGYRFARDFANDVGVKYGSYVQWEKNQVEISLNSLTTIYNFIKSKLSDEKIHLEDLIILESEK